MTATENLVRQHFLKRFVDLQSGLERTLTDSVLALPAKLHCQEQLIVGLENWISDAIEFYALPKSSLTFFNEVLAINRAVYQMKALKLHKFIVPLEESNCLLHSMERFNETFFNPSIEDECFNY